MTLNPEQARANHPSRTGSPAVSVENARRYEELVAGGMSEYKAKEEVWPSHPQMSDPWELAASWGADRTPPAPGERPWTPPGPPPGWADRTGALVPSHRRFSPAMLGLVLAVVLVGVSVAIMAVLGSPPDSDAPPASVVTTTGTCEKRIVGAYAMVATVRTHNPTGKAERGLVWAKWPITGKSPYVFSQEVVLAPGATHEFYVDEPVPGADWFHLEACSYGWTKDGW